MANIWEKVISILAGNLNSGLSYLITTVCALVWGREYSVSSKVYVCKVDNQNLHWKLGQQAPSFGSILAYLETTARPKK